MPLLQAYTLFHVLISLIAIAFGFAAMADLLRSRRGELVTKIFLLFTILTSVTGFFFPFKGFTPAYAFGVLSLILLGVAVVAYYKKQLAGHWRWIYVATAVLSQYLNVFVLVVQSFLKVPVLHDLAPTQNEPPFAVGQGLVLFGFVAFTILVLKRYRPTAIG